METRDDAAGAKLSPALSRRREPLMVSSFGGKDGLLRRHYES